MPCFFFSTYHQDGEDYENRKSRTGPQRPVRGKKSHCHAQLRWRNSGETIWTCYGCRHRPIPTQSPQKDGQG